MSKKLTLDKSTLARLQAEQLQAIAGGQGCQSGIITIDVDGDLDQAPQPDIEAQSCCNKSCRKR